MKWLEIGRKFFERFFRKTSTVEKTKVKEITKRTSRCQEMVAPFIGSKFRSSEAEAMAYILSETARRNGKSLEDKIFYSEVYSVIKQLKEEKNMPTVYEFFPQKCWNAFREMGDTEQLEIVPRNGPNKAWIKVMPDSILAKMIWV